MLYTNYKDNRKRLNDIWKDVSRARSVKTAHDVCAAHCHHLERAIRRRMSSGSEGDVNLCRLLTDGVHVSGEQLPKVKMKRRLAKTARENMRAIVYYDAWTDTIDIWDRNRELPPEYIPVTGYKTRSRLTNADLRRAAFISLMRAATRDGATKMVTTVFVGKLSSAFGYRLIGEMSAFAYAELTGKDAWDAVYECI